MQQTKWFRGRLIPATALCAALSLTPAFGVQKAWAETQEAQQSSVHGTVVDENGDPVIGATVLVDGRTKDGAITDLDGNFTINVKPGTRLKISYVG